MKRITFSAAALAFGIGLASFGAPAALASQATAVQITSVQPANDWFSGGTYPTVSDCNEAGQHALSSGFAQYRCNPAYAPDGAIVYWQLWIEYP